MRQSRRSRRIPGQHRILSTLAMLLLLAGYSGLGTDAATAQPTEPNQGQPLPPAGEVIVVMKPGANAAQVAA
ncbi:MAG: hypothetical protein H0W06_09520, partial [Chloroflexia bacterium]|nr:hypothetical protein [Chloroflexia bacterium]